MPQRTRKKFLKIPFESLDVKKSDLHCDSNPLEKKDRSILKPGIPLLDNSRKLKETRGLPKNVLDSDSRKVRLIGNNRRMPINTFEGKLPLRSRNVIMNKLPKNDASFLDNKIANSNMDTQTFIKKERKASRFLSVMMKKGKMIRHKMTAQFTGRKVWHDEENRRLSQIERLQLLQALSNEPLSFLDLHVCFGVSKQTIKGFVKKGLLTEMWGPKSIGVRFKLTSKGRDYLKELEVAAKCEPNIKEKAVIRLKHKTFI